MNAEHRRRVTAEQAPDPDSSLPNAAPAGRLPLALRRAGYPSHAPATVDAAPSAAAAPVATTEYASRLCTRAAAQTGGVGRAEATA